MFGVFPVDFNRVKLRNYEHDYINASFVEGYSNAKEYIAAQGPIGDEEEALDARYKARRQRQVFKANLT